jgi:hypothetical protein
LDFYDIVSETCKFDSSLVKRLGFKKIFVLNTDIKAAGHGSENQRLSESSIAFGMDKNQLTTLVKNGATAVAITDSYIDKKLMDTINKEKCVLCLPMINITASYGVERSRNIYKMSKLFAYARKAGIDVCFASMAKTPAHMNSYMQLIELAKLVGSDEQYARHSISVITKSIVEK